MSMHKSVRTALLALAIALPAMSVHAEQYYFYVKNSTTSNITKLQVSPDKATWGDFDVGSGIAPGENAKMNWAPTTNDQPCEQWIRAKFADGATSPPSKQDFCKDMDEPLVFGE